MRFEYDSCEIECCVVGAVCLLLVSSSVTMAVPFCLGRVIDIIYTGDPLKMRENLTTLSVVLLGVFLVGGLCNFGRVYLMSISGIEQVISLLEV